MGLTIKLFVKDNSRELNVLVLKESKRNALADNRSKIVDFRIPVR